MAGAAAEKEAPDFIPASQEQPDFIPAGPAPTTENNEIERASTWKPYAGFTPGNMLSQGWQGLKEVGGSALEMGKDIVKAHGMPSVDLAKKYIVDPARAEAQKAQTAQTPWESFGHSIAEAIPLVGPWAASLGEQAGSGDVGGALARGGAQVLSLKAIPKIPKVAGKVGEAAGKILRTPEGKLRPFVEKTARVGGAAAGHVLGPIGAIGGYEAGPVLAEKIIPKRLGIPRIETPAPFKLTPAPIETEPAVQLPLEMPTMASEAARTPSAMPTMERGRVGPPMQRLGELIEEAAGTPRLEPNVPLREQGNFGGPITFRRPGLMQTPAWEPGRMEAPEKLPTVTTEEPMRQMGAPPLRPNVSLREQPKTAEAPARSEQARLEEKYPDKAARQMVHANGEEMADAIGDDAETMKAIHDLTNPDVRQAMINSGEDMGQQMINNRKASGDMSRQEAFKRLLAKGFTPQRIVELAKQPLTK